MRHIEDRQAVHDLLDVMMDAMNEVSDNWTVSFDLSNYGWNVHVGKDGEQDWRFYSNQTRLDPIEPDIVEFVRKHTEQAIADTNPHGDARSNQET